MRKLQILCLTVVAVFPLVAQDTNPQQNKENDRPQVGERPADTNDTLSPLVVAAGTEIAVRINEAINSTTAAEGQSFSGTVEDPVVSPDGTTLIPRRSDVSLVVRRESGGGSTGSPELALGIDWISIRGNRYAVTSDAVEHSNDQGIGKNRRTAKYVGGGAALGTLLGAIAGGAKGAAVGAAAGAAAGGTAQVLTRGKEVKIPAETTLRFRLDEPLNLKATDR